MATPGGSKRNVAQRNECADADGVSGSADPSTSVSHRPFAAPQMDEDEKIIAQGHTRFRRTWVANSSTSVNASPPTLTLQVVLHVPRASQAKRGKHIGCHLEVHLRVPSE